MLWRLAADLVLLIHLMFIIHAVFGGLLAFWRRWLIWIHLPASIWATTVVILGWPCPLTPVEIHLRQMAGDTGYSGSFIEHYLVPVIYPAGLARPLQVVLGLGVLVVNILVYGLLLLRKARRQP